jgi:plastocyanin
MIFSKLKNVRTLVLLCVLTTFPSTARAATVSVTVNDNFFSQKDITVNAGDTVTWAWVGFGTHDVTANDGLFKSPLQSRGKTFSFTFTAANVGKHNYFCTPHQSIGMVGSVTVVGAANQAPTVSLTAPGAGATFLTTDTVTFTANASDPDGTVSKVEFFSDGNLIGTDTTGPSPYSVTASLPAGTHSITAKATDNSNATTTSTPVSITVNAPQNQPPTITLLEPANNATFLTSDTITFSANANDDAGVAKVEFFSDGFLIGSADTTAPYSASASLAAGTHSITAKATDTGGLSTTTQPISITVNAPNQAPTVTLTSPQNGATFSPADTITFSADASDDVSVAKVEFFADGNLIGFADTTAPYSVSGSLAAGQHSITAKATDNTGLSTTSNPITITVAAGNAPPTVTLASAQDL